MIDRTETAQQLLDAVLASMGEAVLVVEPDGRQIRNCNAAAEELFGYEKGELVGQTTRILHVDQEHYERFAKQGEPVLEQGEVFKTEFEMKKKDGTIIETFNTVSPIREDLGWESGVISIVRDITEQKKKDRELKRERDRLQEAQRIGLLGDWYYDVKKDQITWTPMMYEIFERDPEQGPPTYEELRQYYPNYKYHDRMVDQAIQDNTPFSIDLDIHTEKNRTKCIHIEGKPISNDNGEVTKLYGIVQDITERQQAYEREKHLKQVFYRALDMAPLPALIRREDGDFTFINEAFCHRTGFDKEEISDIKDWAQKGRPDFNTEQFHKRVNEVFTGQPIIYGDKFRIQTKEGEERIWDISAANLGVLPGDDQQSAIMMAADVTELEWALDRMEMEMQKFSQLFSHSPDAIAVTDPDGRITDVNASFEELFGYSLKEAKGQNIDRLLTRGESHYKQAHTHTSDLKKGERYRFEAVRYTKNNEKVNVHIGGATVEMDNSLQSLFHIYTNVTKRKEAEEAHFRKEQELSTLFSNLPGMAYRCQNNRNYTMHFVSDGCKDLTGYDPEDLIQDKVVAYGNLIHPKDKDYVWNHVQQALQAKSHFEIEYRIRTREGKVKWVWERGTSLGIDDDEEVTLQGIISDITESKIQQQKLEELLKQKNTLIQEIHHRVKNNMAIISGLLDLQKQQLDNPKAIEALNNSQMRLHTMANVHERLYREKDLTDIQSGDYIRKLLDLHRDFYAGSGISIDSDIESFKLNVNQAIPLGLLLNEVITNACQHAFSDDQEGTITTSLKLQNNQIEAKVTDNGEGMDPDYDPEAADTLGFTIINTLTSQLDADLKIDTGKKGTDVKLTFTREEPKGSASNLESDFS